MSPRHCEPQAITPSMLEARGIQLENVVTYANNGGQPLLASDPLKRAAALTNSPHVAVPNTYYFIFTLQPALLGRFVFERGAEADARWPLIKVDRSVEAHPTEPRKLLEWATKGETRAKCRGAGDCLGLQQGALERFIKEVVHLFTASYVGPEGAARNQLPHNSCP